MTVGIEAPRRSSSVGRTNGPSSSVLAVGAGKPNVEFPGASARASNPRGRTTGSPSRRASSSSVVPGLIACEITNEPAQTPPRIPGRTAVEHAARACALRPLGDLRGFEIRAPHRVAKGVRAAPSADPRHADAADPREMDRARRPTGSFVAAFIWRLSVHSIVPVLASSSTKVRQALGRNRGRCRPARPPGQIGRGTPRIGQNTLDVLRKASAGCKFALRDEDRPPAPRRTRAGVPPVW